MAGSIVSTVRRKVLLWSTAILLFLAVASIAASIWHTARQGAEALDAESRLVSKRVADEYGLLRTALNRSLAEIAIAPAGAGQDREMTRAIRDNPTIDVLVFQDGKTKPIVTTRSGAPIAPETLGAPDCEVGAWKVVSLSPAGAPERRAAFCLRSRGDGRYLAFGALSLRRLNEFLSESKTDPGMELYVSDATRRVLAHSALLPALRNENIPAVQEGANAFWERLALSSGKSVDLVEGAKVRSTVAIPGIDWKLHLERGIVHILKPVQSATILLGAVAGLLLLVTAFATRKLSQHISQPIIELDRSIRESDSNVTIAASPPAHSGITEIDQLKSTYFKLRTSLDHQIQRQEEVIELRTGELKQTNQALEVANRHKSDFLAHMSHELRTPLNAVIGFSEMLKAQYFGPLNTKQAEYVRDINASGQHLLSLINDILDLAKVEAGHMELSLGEVSIKLVVDTSASLIASRCTQKSQTLSVLVEPEGLSWRIDERKVKQCLLNLLTNAHKFTPEGGVIALTVKVVEGQLECSVRDSGVGIPADSIPKLFNEFYQVDSVTGVVGQQEGTGLGLSLTKKFVELHGGSVSVESTLNEGSVFTLRFPKGEI